MNEIILGHILSEKTMMKSQQIFHLEVRWESRKEQVDEEWVFWEVRRKPGSQENSRKEHPFPKVEPWQWNEILQALAKLPSLLLWAGCRSASTLTLLLLFLFAVQTLLLKSFLSEDMLIYLANVTALACDLMCLLIQPTWIQFYHQRERYFSIAQGKISAVKETNAG